MTFSSVDEDKVRDRYRARFLQHGHSQESVGWGKKGKQRERFDVLVSNWDLAGKRVLDVGAGFGDLYDYLSPIGIRSYLGVELVPELAEAGVKVYGKNKNFKMITGNVAELPLEPSFDVGFVSGMFNFRLTDGQNYDFIEKTLTKMFSLCSEGVACNFLTDRVDFSDELIFNSKPEKILEMGLKLTKNVVLRNDYFPFEFSLFLNKDESFSKEDTIFNRYKKGRS